MYLVESHNINHKHKFYKEIDNLCFLSKNLYNKANYLVRQKFIETSKLKEQGLIEHATYLNYYDIRRLLIKDENYIALPRKVSNQTLMQLDENWKSFFKSIKDWKINPSKYKGRPKLPKYKHKLNGRFLLKFESDAISHKELKSGYIKLSQNNIKLKFINYKDDNNKLKEVRIVPLNNKLYKIEIIYDKRKEINYDLNKNNYLSIDLGLNNLCTLTSNKPGFIPVIINGRPLKSINQYYNKKKAYLQSKLLKNVYTTKQLEKLTIKRNNKIKDYIHKSTKSIIKICISNNIGSLIIGYNKQWKDEINLGNKTNQNFVCIPFMMLINQLKYKCELIGIDLILQEESYTSKASFLDLDNIPIYEKNIKNDIMFSGKRISRGMYKSNITGKKINADVNGSYNIMRKAIPNIFKDNGIEDVAVHPMKIVYYS